MSLRLLFSLNNWVANSIRAVNRSIHNKTLFSWRRDCLNFKSMARVRDPLTKARLEAGHEGTVKARNY